jgi:hypothetical protein
MILRLYGRGRVLRRGSPEYAQLLATEFGSSEPLGVRQIITLDIELVQTSSGTKMMMPCGVTRIEQSALLGSSRRGGSSTRGVLSAVSCAPFP